MLAPDTLLALVAFAFVSSITPGPNNLMLMASGTNFGFARTVPHMLGVAVGFVIMLILVGTGVAWVLQAIPIAYAVLRVISVAYLLYLAFKIATARPPASKGSADGSGGPLTFIQAAAFQWVNPKAWTMALTAVSAYAPVERGTIGLVVVGLIFGLINLPSVGVWALLGVQMRRFLHDANRLRAFNVTTALLLIASLYPIIFDTGPTA